MFPIPSKITTRKIKSKYVSEQREVCSIKNVISMLRLALSITEIIDKYCSIQSTDRRVDVRLALALGTGCRSLGSRLSVIRKFYGYVDDVPTFNTSGSITTGALRMCLLANTCKNTIIFASSMQVQQEVHDDNPIRYDNVSDRVDDYVGSAGHVGSVGHGDLRMIVYLVNGVYL